MIVLKSFILLILILLTTPFVIPEEAKSYRLSTAYQKWLDEVYWIISDYEKNAFLSLPSDEERNGFIEAFWGDRDPTPGTKKNEFKDEHYRRFEYATKHFGRESSLPGWKTDRGRVYILLGKPESTKRAAGSFEFFPMELWHYIGYEGYGLPSSLYMLFFQDKGIPPYRLYSPLQDGVRALFNASKIEMNRAQENLYDYMRHNLEPEFSQAALSLIPSEGGFPGVEGTMASVSSEVIMGKLQNARNFQVAKRTYVEDILRGRPTVKVYYSIGSEGIRDGVYWFQAPTGNFYLDFAVEYEPRKLDMGQYEEEYYTSLTVDGQIATDQKTVVDQIVGNHEIKLNKDQIRQVGSIPFQYQARKAIVPGKFGVTLIMTNNLSRQAATFTYDVEIPNMLAYSKPYLTRLLPVRSIEKVKPSEVNKLRPFQYGDNLYTPNIPAKYKQTGVLQVYHQIIFNEAFLGTGSLALHYLIQSGNKVEREVVDPLSVNTMELAGNSIEVKKEIQLSDLALGPKELLVQLTQDQKIIGNSPSLNFSVEADVNPGVWKFSTALPGLDSEYHKYTLSQQLMNMNKTKEALSLLEAALQQNSESMAVRVELMRAALKAKEYSRVIEIGNPIEVHNPNHKDLLWLMGWAYYGLEKYTDAVRFFERLRFVDPKRVEVLNLLADIYYRLNLPEKSLEKIQESLALKPDQKQILELREKVQSVRY